MQRVLIVGAGIIGLFTAYFLSKHKNISVTIVDKQAFGQATSWAGGGIVSPLYPWRYGKGMQALVADSLQYYPKIVSHLQAETKIVLDYFQSGMCVVSPEDYDDAVAWSNKHHTDVNLLNKKQIKAKLPNFNIEGDKSLFFKNTCNIRNPRLLKALIAYLNTQKNIECFEYSPCHSIEKQAKRIMRVKVKNHTMTFDKILFTAGVETQTFLSALSHTAFKLFPVKGQILMWKAPKGWLNHMVLYKGHYVIPRAHSHVLVGATLEKGIDTLKPTQAAYEYLRDIAFEMFPDLAQFPLIAQWTGLRPGSNQELPFIGKLPEYENAYVAAGHYRDGLLLGPATGLRMSKLLLDS